MLDKNHDIEISHDLQKMKQILEQKTMNLITYSDPFIKIVFVEKILKQTKIPIIYLDFDLLLSGYVNAEILPTFTNNSLFQPTKKNWNNLIKQIIFQLTKEKSIIIIDSLNGFFNISEEKDAGRIIYSYIMLFYRIADMNNSKILLLTKTDQKDQRPILSTTGRQIIDTKKLNKINLEQKNSHLTIRFDNDEKDSIKFSFPITFELR